MTHSRLYRVTPCLLGLVIPFAVMPETRSAPPEASKGAMVRDHASGYVQLATWLARSEQVRKELKKDGKQPWEGQFYDSPFHGLSLRPLISRKAGYVSTGRTLDYGKAEVAEDREAGEYRLLLISDLPFSPKVHEYFVIRWGERVYLVEPKLLLEFCNAVNSGQLRSKGQVGCLFLLRAEDHEKEVSGIPAVPKQYAEYILRKPIRGTLVRHDRVKERVAVAGMTALAEGLVVSLNVGYEEGVRTGMAFYPEGIPYEKTSTGYAIAVGKHDADLILMGKREAKHYPKSTKFSTVDPAANSP